MGSKGQSTTSQNQNQTQTYAPNAQAAGYIQSALQTGANAAQLPFNIPQAPVAGFSQDQQRAFGLVNQAQGQAQPYYNQAASYFSPQGAQQFANPYIDQVTANLKDIFGQQQSQTTGQLTQAAGGVGADRIAVGQSELAKQQGLAAGQTYSQIYQNAAQNAQAAGYGTANLGQASQNSALQGANQLLGTGGLQQQLSQAQMNSPYQQQLAQAAFPYQQAQFLAGITGSLAPGLGGTTSGQSYGTGTSTPAQPSIWSQLLGAGVAGAGLYGGLGGSGSAYNPFGSNASYGGGNAFSGDAYGGSASSPLPGLSKSDYAARGGVINPFAEGGGVSDQPIDVSQAFKIPSSQMQPMQAHIPQLNFSQPQQQQQSGSSGKGGGPSVGDVAKIAMMFANRGGVVDPFNGASGYADGGAPDDAPASFDERFPYRMAGTPAMDRWRESADAALPPKITGSTPAAQEGTALSFAPQRQAAAADDAALPENSQPTAGTGNPYAPPSSAADDDTGQSFAKSPWAALTAAGLGIMGGTSPFAGVNIGQGAQQGLKTLETQRTDAQKDTTIAQAAKRLQQEADFHNDQYTKMTPAQKATAENNDEYLKLAKEKQRLDDLKPVEIGRDIYGIPILAKRNKDTGEYEVIKPPGKFDPSGSTPQSSAPATIQPTSNKQTEAVNKAVEEKGVIDAQSELPKNAQFVSEPAVVPQNPGVLEGLQGVIPKGEIDTIKAIGEGRQPFLPVGRNNPKNQFLMDKVHEVYPDADATLFNRRQRTANFFAVGTQGGGGQNISAMNTLAQHMEKMLKLNDKLDLGRFQDKNDMLNELAKRGYGSKERQDLLREWEAVQTGVAGEAAKVFAGSNTAHADRADWLAKFHPGIGKAGIEAALRSTVDMVEGRLSALTNQYNEGMRTDRQPQQMIAKGTRDAFDHVKKLGEAGATSPATAAAPAAKPDPQARFGQLTSGGMTPADAYKKMHEEGY